MVSGGQGRGGQRPGEGRVRPLGGEATGTRPVFALARSQAINAHYQPNIITT